MYDETELNPELTELERSLSRLELPDCQLNRDELMYRSGWEAAFASSNHAAPFSSIGGPTGRHWLLPAISVLSSAAAILFGSVLLNQSLNREAIEMAVAQHVDTSDVEIAEPHPMEPADPMNVVVAPDLLQRVMDLPAGVALQAGMLVGPHYPVDSEPGAESPVSRSFENLAPPMTQQRLLNELLPNRTERTRKWSLFRAGGNS